MTAHTYHWEGRTAIVTGGTSGLGLATVAALAARGAEVVAVARNTGGLRLAPSPWRSRVHAISADVGRAEQAASAVEWVIGEFGRLDVLVNTAGYSLPRHQPLAATTDEEWNRMLDANLTGMFLMCRAALPQLAARPDGYIVNVLSTVAHMTAPGATAYAATKGGARALTESLIEECRGTPLRVSALSPGKMDTPTWDLKDEPPTAAERAVMMDPADVAEIVAWLVERPAHLHIPAIMVRPWEF